MTSNTLAKRSKRSGRLESRICTLMQQEIAYVGNREFSQIQGDDVKSAEAVLARRMEIGTEGAVDHELPPHLACMCISELLQPEEERSLFRYMNYLKFRANSLRSQLDPATSSATSIRKITDALEKAERIREHLVHSNIRLVISIVRKHVSRQCSFDELLSEGLAALVLAAEKFDYFRGFRFSTYAYQVVSRSLFRLIKVRQRDATRFMTSSDLMAVDSEGSDDSDLQDGELIQLRKKLGEFVQKLDRRERFIIRCRFALGSHRHARTLQEIADKLRVSKERVRQIEKRAIAKLKVFAEGLLDDNALLSEWAG